MMLNHMTETHGYLDPVDPHHKGHRGQAECYQQVHVGEGMEVAYRWEAGKDEERKHHHHGNQGEDNICEHFGCVSK